MIGNKLIKKYHFNHDDTDEKIIHKLYPKMEKYFEMEKKKLFISSVLIRYYKKYEYTVNEFDSFCIEKTAKQEIVFFLINF